MSKGGRAKKFHPIDEESRGFLEVHDSNFGAYSIAFLFIVLMGTERTCLAMSKHMNE